MVHFVPLRKIPSARDLASLFISNILRLHGIPESITSDRGSQFVSRFWRAFCKVLGISLAFSSAFHPQSNGQTERFNQTLEQYLRCYVASRQNDWVKFLPLAEFAINNHTNSSTKMSPFFCNYGVHPRFSSARSVCSEVPGVQVFIKDLKGVWESVQANILNAQKTQATVAKKKRQPGPVLLVGQLVWLSTRNLKLRVPSGKLAPKFIGPYKILEEINPVAFKLQLPVSFKIHNVFHRSLLKKFVPPSASRTMSPPKAVVVLGRPEFEVRRIVDCRRGRSGLQFLVDWKGYGPEDRSWVKQDDLHADRLLKRFFQDHPEKQAMYSRDPEGSVEGRGTVSPVSQQHVQGRSQRRTLPAGPAPRPLPKEGPGVGQRRVTYPPPGNPVTAAPGAPTSTGEHRQAVPFRRSARLRTVAMATKGGAVTPSPHTPVAAPSSQYRLPP